MTRQTGETKVKSNWTELAPGVYADETDGMHIVVDEFLIGAGYAPTPHNREMIENAVQALAKKIGARVYQDSELTSIFDLLR